LKPGLIFKGKGLKPVAFKLWVSAQVAFDRHILKPGLMFNGKGLKPSLFQAMGQLAPPRRGGGDGAQRRLPSVAVQAEI
jgi:hypothetical protein